jgi:hypothetical protein
MTQRRARDLAQAEGDPARLTEGWRDVEEYALVRFAKVNVGAAVTTVRRVERPAPHFEAELRIGLRPQLLLGKEAVSILARAVLDERFNLDTFHITIGLSTVRTTVTGRVAGGHLDAEVDVDGQKRRVRYAVAGPISLLEAVRPAAVRQLRIEPGSSIRVPVVDPVMSMDVGVMEISVVGRETIETDRGTTEAFRVEARLNDFVMTSHVDASGRTLRQQLVGGFVLDRTTSATARAAMPELFAGPIPMPVLDASAFDAVEVQSPGRLPSAGRSPLSVLSSFSR